MPAAFALLVAAGVVVLSLIRASVRVLNEYERGVVFRLGRLGAIRGPGLIFLLPVVDRMVRVSLRTVTMDVPAQDVITRDNVSVKVNAVVYFHVMDPSRAIVKVENFMYATSQLSQTTLRSVLGQATLDELLSERDKLNETLRLIVGELHKLRERPPGQAEFNRARDYVIGQIDLALESTENRMMALGEQVLGYGKAMAPEASKRRLAAVTPAEVRAAAREFFRPERATLALVSPRKRLPGVIGILSEMS